ncbi:nucleotide sugar dehydrogenase [Bacillus wiedmannii]|uniref:nucleotide sugar dehydrogenase n=1 Tax=Bacillus wiedmannii TaxID=1890302 RepID=UPI0012482185|nr:nucleotide sugar dehydrogenase [Bacillus wiedmannii]
MYNLYENILEKKNKISIIGLGYVGLPLAVAFAKHVDVIGFDINTDKIQGYKEGIDVTGEVGNQAVLNSNINFTSNELELKEASLHIVSVPTPIGVDKTPDLKPIIESSKLVGRNLQKGSIVVYESTVYPGVTEEVCVPILESESGLKCGVDFKVGYSPERINPGDKVNTVETIVKIVSGMDNESLDIISKVYELIVVAGVYRAESIKVAEAAKVIENSQRDINIAFMNELSMVFNKMGIDTKEVLKAAGTKWNFLNFTPGLVGGHCIGVDPYYFIYKAEQLGYHSQIILSGRKINDDMGKYVAENTIKSLVKADKCIKGCNIAIFGIAFKENCPDARNTKVMDIINNLKEYGINITIVDPVVNEQEVLQEYGIELYKKSEISNMDAIVFAVPHDEFNSINMNDIINMSNENPILIDVRRKYDKNEAEEKDIIYWGL